MRCPKRPKLSEMPYFGRGMTVRNVRCVSRHRTFGHPRTLLSDPAAKRRCAGPEMAHGDAVPQTENGNALIGEAPATDMEDICNGKK